MSIMHVIEIEPAAIAEVSEFKGFRAARRCETRASRVREFDEVRTLQVRQIDHCKLARLAPVKDAKAWSWWEQVAATSGPQNVRARAEKGIAYTNLSQTLSPGIRTHVMVSFDSATKSVFDVGNVFGNTLIPGETTRMQMCSAPRLASKIVAEPAMSRMPIDTVACCRASLMDRRAGACDAIRQHNMIGGDNSTEKWNWLSRTCHLGRMDTGVQRAVPATKVLEKALKVPPTRALFERIKAPHTLDAESCYTSEFNWHPNKLSECLSAAIARAEIGYREILNMFHSVEPIAERVDSMIKALIAESQRPGNVWRSTKRRAMVQASQNAFGATQPTVGALRMFMNRSSGGSTYAASSGPACGALATDCILGSIGASTPTGAPAAAVFGTFCATRPACNVIQASAGVCGHPKVPSPLVEALAAMPMGAMNFAAAPIAANRSVASKLCGTTTPVLDGIMGMYSAPAMDGNADVGGIRRGAFKRDGNSNVFRNDLNEQTAPSGAQFPYLEATAFQHKLRPSEHTGCAGVNIEKVEIVVASSQDPSSIARAVLHEIQNIRRHPKASPYVSNYGTP